MTTISSLESARHRSRPALLEGISAAGLLGGAVLLAIALSALLAPWIAPYAPEYQQLDGRLVPPAFMGGSWQHWLGTDALGRDLLSRLLHGARLTLFIGIVSTIISAIIGISMGMAAGYFRGRVETVVGFLITVRLSMPIMLIMLSLVGLLGNSTALIMIVLSCFLWDRFAVVSRSITLQLQGREYVVAAKAAGCGDLRILLGEILPNLARPLLVVATLEVAHAILLESALSFLGLGVKSPEVSWGLMIAEAKEFIFFEPWMLNLSGLMIFVLIGAINLFCEGLKASAELQN
jgi:peptide/nickel transport system permease protein